MRWAHDGGCANQAAAVRRAEADRIDRGDGKALRRGSRSEPDWASGLSASFHIAAATERFALAAMVPQVLLSPAVQHDLLSIARRNCACARLVN
jgi:hypothetical protein